MQILWSDINVHQDPVLNVFVKVGSPFLCFKYYTFTYVHEFVFIFVALSSRQRTRLIFLGLIDHDMLPIGTASGVTVLVMCPSSADRY